MENTDTASRAPPRALDLVPKPGQEIDKQYSPGDFFRQFGVVIAVCLGLALAANVLVTLSGPY